MLTDFEQAPSPKDQSPRPGDPEFRESPHDGHSFCNPGGASWRLATDALLHGDAWSRALAMRRGSRVRADSGGARRSFARAAGWEGERFDGRDYGASFFGALFGVAAMLEPDAGTWLDAVWALIGQGRLDSFRGGVAPIGFRVMTGFSGIR